MTLHKIVPTFFLSLLLISGNYVKALTHNEFKLLLDHEKLDAYKALETRVAEKTELIKKLKDEHDKSYLEGFATGMAIGILGLIGLNMLMKR